MPAAVGPSGERAESRWFPRGGREGPGWGLPGDARPKASGVGWRERHWVHCWDVWRCSMHDEVLMLVSCRYQAQTACYLLAAGKLGYTAGMLAVYRGAGEQLLGLKTAAGAGAGEKSLWLKAAAPFWHVLCF